MKVYNINLSARDCLILCRSETEPPYRGDVVNANFAFKGHSEMIPDISKNLRRRLIAT